METVRDGKEVGDDRGEETSAWRNGRWKVSCNIGCRKERYKLRQFFQARSGKRVRMLKGRKGEEWK